MSTTLGNLSIAVGRPWWLILLPLILPPLILLSRRSLAGLGTARRALAILVRSAVVALLVLALAEVQAVRKNEKLTTLFLVDVSQSLPREWQRPVLDYVNNAILRQKRSEDLAGVIVFGKEPRIETPPSPTFARLLGVESTVDPEYTDIGAALKLALATFPEDSARRIVLISDGNENRGNALEQAAAAKQLGVQIDALPVEYHYDREVLVEKVSLPPDVKEGETVNINVVLHASEPTRGTLQIFQKADNYRAPAPGNEQPVPIELQRGVNVRTLRQKITQPNFYTFTAEFIPDRDSGDRRAINNVAEGFTQVRGTAQALLIEGTRGENDHLVKALREKGIAVTVLVAPRIEGSGDVGGDPLPTDLAQLQPYDTVILGNVPKDSFTETQIKMLEANVHDMGGGLVMIGGPNSFGAGGWMNTPVEKALPVDMQIKAMRVMGKSALVLIMHASEIPEGNYWQKVVAQQAIKTLSSYDYCGLLHWEGQEAWLFTLREIGNGRGTMLRLIDRMTPGDMPDFDPSLLMGLKGLRAKTDAMTKHIIVISDGDPTPPTSQVIQQLANSKVTVTTVLTAAHGNDPGARNVMRNLSNKTKGRFYEVTNPKALPRIYQKEARLISRPLIFEQRPPWRPTLNYASEPITNLPTDLPGITGLVQTTVKENELVEVPLTSPLPKGQLNPVLAHWTYGLGRAVAFTSDAGRRWASLWPEWPSYAAFWSQVIRWSMRPVEKGNLTLAARRENGAIKVVVDALDKNNDFLNFLQIQGNVLSPDLKRTTLELVQTAPGHYEATIEGAEASGNYFINLAYRGGGGVQGFLSTGISVPYSDEYRELRSNPANLETLASLTGGSLLKWRTRPDGQINLQATLDARDVFRRDPSMVPPRSFQDLWPTLLWLAAILFLSDVAVRRIAPDFDRMRRAIGNQWKRLRGQTVAPPSDYMEKLKSRKAEVDDQLERSRVATRFEAPTLPPSSVGEPLLEGQGDRPRPPAPPSGPAPGLAPDPKAAEAESYTNRLLRAKQRVWEQRDKDKS